MNTRKGKDGQRVCLIMKSYPVTNKATNKTPFIRELSPLNACYKSFKFRHKERPL